VTLTYGSFWVYESDALGQVKIGNMYWADGTHVPGQQFEYRIHEIGNESAAVILPVRKKAAIARDGQFV